ncbi:unnamed protein product, partial [Mesorhabditis belari]|uniref:Major facilitator superfamily (MFS) profile domain-containing protein n=1 Tax=Mesorhabditis belari TaxID=2138241 RepID=A0AAF3FJU2_9BILA
MTLAENEIPGKPKTLDLFLGVLSMNGYKRFGFKIMPSWSIHLLSLALCLSSGFQQGYIAAVLNQPYKQIEQYIKDSYQERTGTPLDENVKNIIWSALNISFPIATIVGQFAASVLCKKYGRKRTALFSSFLYIPGGLISVAAKYCHPYYELLFVGRFIWSLANGINGVVATVWIVECAPPQIRGRMAAMQEMFMSIGSLVTQAIGVPASTDTLWPLVFVPGMVIAAISLVMFAFVYESPQYIIEQSGDRDKARAALAAYHGVEVDDPSLEEEMRICEAAIQKKTQKKNPLIEQSHDGLTIMLKPWKANDTTSQVIRHAAWVGLMVKVVYVFTGARCLRGYSTFLLHDLSHWSTDGALYGSFFVGLARVPVTLIPVFLVDRLGRRPLLLSSTLICALSLLTMMLSIFAGEEFKVGTLTGLTALLLLSACGIGSISRFYASELVPRSLLLNATSYLTMFEALTKIGVEFAFYPVANLTGGWSLMLFLVPTALFLVPMWAMCPETSRKHVNEVLNEIAVRKNLKVSFNS